jgi:uncharacterized coiled-coil protein SlyX
MDFNILNGWLILIATGCGVVIWYLYRSLHAKVDAGAIELNSRAASAEKALAEFKLHCAETYVTANNFERALQGLTETFKAVFAKLDRIEDKLDGKADK